VNIAAGFVVLLCHRIVMKDIPQRREVHEDRLRSW